MTRKEGYLVRGNTGAETYEENMLLKKLFFLCSMCECLAFLEFGFTWEHLKEPPIRIYKEPTVQKNKELVLAKSCDTLSELSI